MVFGQCRAVVDGAGSGGVNQAGRGRAGAGSRSHAEHHFGAHLAFQRLPTAQRDQDEAAVGFGQHFLLKGIVQIAVCNQRVLG